jgi:sulfur relay (sulfurtransferase) complex TusBCD TusD component (DsrE family)
MVRRKLIFFVTADPADEVAPAIAAYLLADAALAAGLDAEVRLANDAVLVADPGYLATVPECSRLRQGLDRAVARGVVTTVCPEAVDGHGIPDEQLDGIGASRRPLAEILAEVREDRSVVVPL